MSNLAPTKGFGSGFIGSECTGSESSNDPQADFLPKSGTGQKFQKWHTSTGSGALDDRFWFLGLA